MTKKICGCLMLVAIFLVVYAMIWALQGSRLSTGESMSVAAWIMAFTVPMTIGVARLFDNAGRAND